MNKAAMRHAIAALLLTGTALAGCGPAGVVASTVVKGAQAGNAEDYERDLRQRFAAQPSLRDIKVSVTLSNGWRDAFRTRYSVLLAGTIPAEADRKAATQMVWDAIGATPDTVAIADHMRIELR
jgi:hypothetical protein